MDNDIFIRKSQKQDFQQLMEMENNIWNESITPSKIHWSSVSEYENQYPPGKQLVAVLEETICGYLGFSSPTELLSNKHVSEIVIAIHPNFQRMGIGKRLVNAAKQRAVKEGIKKLSLRVLSTNKSAIDFYKRCGFQEQGRLINEFKLNEHYVDDVLMYLFIEDLK